jgi:acyl-CoA synthetase (AMP-forming)/AMP-acid ligase II
MFTIGELLRSRAELSPELEAVVSPGARFSFREYLCKVNQLAHFLLERNIQKGDRIAYICKNDYPFPVLYLAAATVGAVTVPLNTWLKPAEIEWIVKDCQPKLLFYDAEFADVVSGLENLPFLEAAVRIGEGGSSYETFENILKGRPDHAPEAAVLPEDPALIIYTSGTTGYPKGVVCTHRNVFAAACGNVHTLDLRFGDRFLFVTPLFHISGMMFIINALVRGMTLVAFPGFNPIEIWDLINRERITGMMSVPSMLPFMLETLRTYDRDVSTLRGIVCGGSLVPKELIRAFYDLGFAVIQVYGATEFTGAATYWMPHMGIEKCASVGKGLYMTRIKIVDPLSGAELPPGEIGEIALWGEQVFVGYWNREEETKRVLKNGWYHTGDVGKLDEDGFLYVIDRLKDMVICGGVNVFPAQVEAVLLQLEGVAEAAVVGVKHPVWGELPRAYVVRKEGCSLTEEEVLRHVHAQLADYNLREVVFVNELPKNSMGKVLKYVLREHANRSENIPRSKPSGW